MSTERAYEAALIHLEQELDGFVGAAFVELSSGHLLAAHAIDPGLHQRALIGAARATVTAHLELGNGQRSARPHEVIVTTGEHIHLHHVLPSDVLLIVTAMRGDTNLALVRVAANRCSDRLRSSGPAGAASVELQ